MKKPAVFGEPPAGACALLAADPRGRTAMEAKYSSRMRRLRHAALARRNCRQRSGVEQKSPASSSTSSARRAGAPYTGSCSTTRGTASYACPARAKVYDSKTSTTRADGPRSGTPSRDGREKHPMEATFTKCAAISATSFDDGPPPPASATDQFPLLQLWSGRKPSRRGLEVTDTIFRVTSPLPLQSVARAGEDRRWSVQLGVLRWRCRGSLLPGRGSEIRWEEPADGRGKSARSPCCLDPARRGGSHARPSPSPAAYQLDITRESGNVGGTQVQAP